VRVENQGARRKEEGMVRAEARNEDDLLAEDDLLVEEVVGEESAEPSSEMLDALLVETEAENERARREIEEDRAQSLQSVAHEFLGEVATIEDEVDAELLGDVVAETAVESPADEEADEEAEAEAEADEEAEPSTVAIVQVNATGEGSAGVSRLRSKGRSQMSPQAKEEALIAMEYALRSGCLTRREVDAIVLTMQRFAILFINSTADVLLTPNSKIEAIANETARGEARYNKIVAWEWFFGPYYRGRSPRVAIEEVCPVISIHPDWVRRRMYNEPPPEKGPPKEWDLPPALRKLLYVDGHLRSLPSSYTIPENVRGLLWHNRGDPELARLLSTRGGASLKPVKRLLSKSPEGPSIPPSSSPPSPISLPTPEPICVVSRTPVLNVVGREVQRRVRCQEPPSSRETDSAFEVVEKLGPAGIRLLGNASVR